MARSNYAKCWSQEAINRYFTSEAMSKTRDDFNRVHVPIDRIIVDPAYPAARGRTEITESGLLNVITSSSPDQSNRIFLIVGDTGSGKSELCQWLNYNITGDVHIPILIERRMTRLTEIVERIHQHLDEPVPPEMVELADLWPETVSAKLRAAVLMRIQQPQVQNAIGVYDVGKLRKILDTPDFERRMRDHFERYREEIQILDQPREWRLLPESDFRELALRVDGVHDASRCYGEIQRAIVDCLATELKVEDLIKKLERISRTYRQLRKRPVLLIEDITTFGFLQNDLLDYLYNLAGGSFDVVMGVTTGFEQANRDQIYNTQQTITERVEGRFELTDSHNETVFLQGHYLDLARRYLGAVRSRACVNCSQKPVCDTAFQGELYPLNEPFLTNVYRSLQQDGGPKRTPRLYLRALQGVLESDLLPMEAIELSSNVGTLTTCFARRRDMGTLAENVIRWYGVNTNAGVYFSKEIARLFGVALPPSVESVEGFYLLGLRPGMEARLPSPPSYLRLAEDKDEESVEEDGGEAEQEEQQGAPPPEPAPEPAEPEPPEPESPGVFGQLDEWLSLKGMFPDRNVCKNGVYALLDLYQFEPFHIRNPNSIAESGTPLVFDRGDRYAKLYLHHSADDKSYHKLITWPDAQRSDLFSQVLAVGTADYQVTDDRLDHAQLYDWLTVSVGELQTEMRQALTQALRMPLETFVALTKFLLLNVTSNEYALRSQTLIKSITGEPLYLTGLGDRARHLWENRDHIQALFVGLFHYRDNVVDYLRLERTIADMDPMLLLREIERIDAGNVSTGFHTRVSGVQLPFRDLVKLIQGYVGYLRDRVRSGNYQLDPTEGDLRKVLSLCSPRGIVDPERLRSQVDSLRHVVRKAGAEWPRRWDIGLDALDRALDSMDFDGLCDDIEELLGLLAEAPKPIDIFAYLALQRSIGLIAKRAEFQVLDTIGSMRRPLLEEVHRRRSLSPVLSKEFQAFREVCQKLQGAVEQ